MNGMTPPAVGPVNPVLHPSSPPVEPLRRSRRFVHLGLFLATFVTVTLNGAFLAGVDLLAEPTRVWEGLPFSIALMSILLVHEFGHYTLARYHGVDASLPYFLPAPPVFIGTFGAFIRMRSLPPGRPALFDVGASGPWAGFVAAVIALVVGLHLSEVRAVPMTEGVMWLGDSLLTSGLTWWVFGSLPEGMTVYFHPIAFAGWVGFLVTVLNLLPMGQLDGGHVAYAMFGRRHAWVARVTIGVLVILGYFQWPGWFVWAMFPLLIGLDHPPTVEDWVPVRGWRRLGGWLTLGMFVLIFMPNPIQWREPPARFEGLRMPVRLDVGSEDEADRDVPERIMEDGREA